MRDMVALGHPNHGAGASIHLSTTSVCAHFFVMSKAELMCIVSKR